MRRGCWTVLLGALAGACLLGCRSPTQIDVVVSTDVACSQVSGTSVTTGTLGEIENVPPTTTTANCANEYIGSVVLVPSGDENALVGFKVVTAINGATVDQCVPGDAGDYGPDCIVARRALRYLPHTPLQVEILMSGQCAGKACDSQSTCVEGVCLPATIGNSAQCEGNGCTEGVLEPDGGVPEPPDATLIQDGAADAQPVDATVGADAFVEASVPSDAAADSPGPSDSGAGVVPGCDLGGALAQAAWPMEEYCPTHRNRSPYLGPASPPTSWTRAFGGSILAAPSIGPDGTLYVAAIGVGNQNAIYALDPKTGNTIWQYAPDSGAGFQSMPVLASDRSLRVVDSVQGTYAVLDLDAGAARLVTPLAYEGIGPLSVRGGLTIVGDGTLYASDNTSDLFAFDSAGTVAWLVHGVSSDYVVPTVEANGTVLTTEEVVNALERDGGPAWVSDSGATELMVTVSVATDGTLRVFSPSDGTLFSLEADGGPRWAIQAGGGQATQLAVSDDGTTYIGAADTLTAWDSNGNAAGSYALPCAQPIIDAAGYVYDICDGQFLVRLDSSLHELWSLPIALGAYQFVNDSPVIGPGGTLFFTVDTNGFPDGGGPAPLDAVWGFIP
jgi:outer membrane protein assembly factor BamB